MIYWFYGQPAAGKTTLAKAYMDIAENKKYIHIDGDNLREITKNFDYTKEGRERNLQSVLDIARFGDAHGFDVYISVVAPYNKHREELFRTNNVCLIHVMTSDIRGRESYFVPEFELSTEPHIVIDTTGNTIEQTLDELITKVNYHIAFNI